MTLLIFQQYLKIYIQNIRNIIFSSSPHEALIKTDGMIGHKETSIIFAKRLTPSFIAIQLLS